MPETHASPRPLAQPALFEQARLAGAVAVVADAPALEGAEV